MSSVVVDHRPYSYIRAPNGRARVESLVRLHDDSFVSCSPFGVKRWTVNNNRILYLGSFGDSEVVCAAEKDNHTVITSTYDDGHRICRIKLVVPEEPERSPTAALKEWNMTTYECINTIVTQDKVKVLLLTKCKQFMVCGLDNNTVEVRRVNDLGIIVSTFKLPAKSTICELIDGSFVSGSYDSFEMKRWDIHGTVLQSFDQPGVQRVIELKSDVIASAAFQTITVWRVSTGERLRTSSDEKCFVSALERLSEDLLLFNSSRAITVWSCDQGDLIESIPTYRVTAMARLRDSIVVATGVPTSARCYDWITGLYIWKLKSEYYASDPITLTEMCCAVISKEKEMYNAGQLKSVLPEELFNLCFGYQYVTTTTKAEPAVVDQPYL